MTENSPGKIRTQSLLINQLMHLTGNQKAAGSNPTRINLSPTKA